jgi:prephenate dehydrogenase
VNYQVNNIQIGIIGGTRGMGRWFADYLTGQGHVVHVSGRTIGKGIEEMTACCQVVVVSVPISITCEIISQVGPLMGKDSLLMDLTSLKAEPVQAMLKHSASEVIGCHPLFGPQIDTVKKHHVVLCPVRTRKWLFWLIEVWEKGGALLVETTPEKHDELMSVVQVLNHLNTIMMGMALSKTSAPLSQLDRFTTPFFDIKAKMVEKIFSDNPRLYAEILCDNPRRSTIIEIYEQVIAELKPAILRGDAEDLAGLMRKAATRLWPSEGRNST